MWKISKLYLEYLSKRIHEDRIVFYAGYLSYVTLLSLVPLLAVVFSAFSLFPVFGEWRGEVEAFVFKNFVPKLGETIQGHFAEFIENATKMTPVGLIVLIVVALLLIYSVDHTLNHIWGVSKNRKLVISFSIYWVVLTLGPILIGTSILATSYLISITGFEENFLLELKKVSIGLLPYIASFSIFCIKQILKMYFAA